MDTAQVGTGTITTPVKTLYPDMVLNNYCDDHHGFMRITINSKTRILKGEFFNVPLSKETQTLPEMLFDSFELDLNTHSIK